MPRKQRSSLLKPKRQTVYNPLKQMKTKLGVSSSSRSPRRGRRVDEPTIELLRHAKANQLLITATYVDRNGVTAEHQFFILEFNEGSHDPRIWTWQLEDGTSPAEPGCFQIGYLSNIRTSEARWTVPSKTPDSDICFGRDPELADGEDIEP